MEISNKPGQMTKGFDTFVETEAMRMRLRARKETA